MMEARRSTWPIWAEPWKVLCIDIVSNSIITIAPIGTASRSFRLENNLLRNFDYKSQTTTIAPHRVYHGLSLNITGLPYYKLYSSLQHLKLKL